MGKSVKERLNETIKRDKLEINKEESVMELKGDKETNVEDFMNKKIKDMISDEEQKLEEEIESDYFEDDFEGETEEKSANGKKIIVALLILIISFSTILVLWSNGYEIINFAFDKVNEINEEKSEVLENENITVAPIDLTQCYQVVHHMANTIIIADDGQIWGKNEITTEAVTQMINELNGRDDYLSGELKKWLELDFSNGVEVHNYVWDKLDGNIGKAKELNQEKIQQVIESMKE